MQKSHPSSSREDHWAEAKDIFVFVGTLVVVLFLTILIYLIPIEVLLLASALGFLPVALYSIFRH